VSSVSRFCFFKVLFSFEFFVASLPRELLSRENAMAFMRWDVVTFMALDANKTMKKRRNGF
jgi:hypothetical protein